MSLLLLIDFDEQNRLACWHWGIELTHQQTTIPHLGNRNAPTALNQGDADFRRMSLGLSCHASRQSEAI
ncbi:hypothetical protein Pan181_01080 [Aeoliella mucimassa]|uniref:Uncharacterized protein n=1 Tax=Aeoliella mucimassa TaxID=2527972 RepID=A0A518AGV3_9BACT|nr:hypothetical protein Pan181_01080 [Aeoliella mucimassa]